MNIDYPDIYYLPEWLDLYAEKDLGKPEYYVLENEHGKIIYPYVKRDILDLINQRLYSDIITPYGFNGPYIEKVYSSSKEDLLESFEKDFTRYCFLNNIVAEYVRFSPWLENSKDFESYYTINSRNKTVAINLMVDNILFDEISSKRRNLIKKAKKMGTKVNFDFNGETIDNFYNLYQQTINKNHINEYYHLSLDFLRRHFISLKGHILIANAINNHEIVSSSIFLYLDKNIHYHFSANNYYKLDFNGNSLILFEVAQWAKQHEINHFHLGGASSSDLMRYKLSFTKSNGLDYYIGTRVRLKNIYYELLKKSKNDTGYFPEYRR